jgi:tryptophanyl-tRNA synthetase
VSDGSAASPSSPPKSVEQTTELVRRFNSSVGLEVLVECAAQVSGVGRLPGIDGKSNW